MKLIYCGVPRWSPNPNSENVSYVYANQRGEEVEIIDWRQPPLHKGVTLYPAGITSEGRVRYGYAGHRVDGLLSAQLEAVEILSRG